MRGISKELRQQTVDAYLEATGREKILPAEFLEWLQPQHNHPAWAFFFGKSESELVQERRFEMVQGFISGLRITIRPTEFVKRSTGGLKVVSSTFCPGSATEPLEAPAFFSPVTARAKGGGYVAFDPGDQSHRESWAEEAARRLDEWLTRYQLAIVDAGMTLDDVRGMRDQLAAFADKTKRSAA